RGSYFTVGWEGLPPLEEGMFSETAIALVEAQWAYPDGAKRVRTERATNTKIANKQARRRDLRAFLIKISAEVIRQNRRWVPKELPVSKAQFHKVFMLFYPHHDVKVDTLYDDVKAEGWSFRRGRPDTDRNPLASLLGIKRSD